MKTEESGDSLLTRSLITLSGAHMVTHVFGRIHTALFPVFREEFQLSLQQLGIIAAIPTLLKMLFYIPSGLLTDRIGEKTLIIVSFIAAGIASLVMSIAPNIIVLTIFLSLLIASITFYHPPAYSLTSELFSKEKRGQALGIHGAGGTLGMALGPISLSLFIGYLFWNWRTIYLFWTIPILLYTLAIWKLRTPKTRQTVVEGVEDTESTSMRSFFTVGIMGFMLFQGARHMGSQIIQTFLPTYIHDNLGVSIAEASFIYGTASLTGIVAAPIGGYLADKVGDKRWLMIALGGYTLLLLIASLMQNLVLFTLFYWSAGFFSSSSMGAASSIIARSTPSGQRGLGFALYFLPGSIVGIIAPIIGAGIADAFGLWSIFPVAVTCIVLSFAILEVGVPSDR